MRDYFLKLTAKITIHYIKENSVNASSLPNLINDIFQSIDTSVKENSDLTYTRTSFQIPAIDPKKSLTDEHITCLECGKSFRTLKKHLKSSHNLSPHEYRNKWSLAPNYPMLTSEYSTRRSKIAKSSGLGRF